MLPKVQILFVSLQWVMMAQSECRRQQVPTWVLQSPQHLILVQLTGPMMESQVLPIMGPDSMMAMTMSGMSSNQISLHMVLTLSQQLRRPGHLSLVLQDQKRIQIMMRKMELVWRLRLLRA